MSESTTYSATVLTRPAVPISTHLVRLSNTESTRYFVRIPVISYIIVDAASDQL